MLNYKDYDRENPVTMQKAIEQWWHLHRLRKENEGKGIAEEKLLPQRVKTEEFKDNAVDIEQNTLHQSKFVLNGLCYYAKRGDLHDLYEQKYQFFLNDSLLALACI